MVSWFKGKPLESYVIRDVNGYAKRLVVCRKWIADKASFVDALRIEDLTSLKNGEVPNVDRT
jgi:hypothetical protein